MLTASKTWEEAAQAARDENVARWSRYKTDSAEFDPLADAETVLSELRDETYGAAPYYWHELVDAAIVGYVRLVGGTGISAIDHVVETIISKQHDYGHDNINWGGRDGLVIRAHDKVARIKNLQQRLDAVVPGQALPSPLNESLADSWLDLAGYGLIGVMFENGTFQLPLAADVPVVSQAFEDLLNEKIEWVAAQIAAEDDYEEETPKVIDWGIHHDLFGVQVTLYEGEDRVHVGGWNAFYGDYQEDGPHGFYLTQGELDQLINTLEDAWCELSNLNARKNTEKRWSRV